MRVLKCILVISFVMGISQNTVAKDDSSNDNDDSDNNDKDDDVEEEKPTTSEDTSDNLSDVETLSSSEQVQETTFQIPDEKWLVTAQQDIAYYLRSYKFNEWDRRYFASKPEEEKIGFYAAFPTPSLRSLHWKVYENCDKNFYKCVTYLQSIVETIPLTRSDDTVTILNEKQIPMNETLKQNLDMECKKAFASSEIYGLPFDGPLERFQWRTSASYYMCWYTMLETPSLTMLGESCDNFAKCLDDTYGAQNHDPRGDDRLSLACALYSFCPDLCCPQKYIEIYSQCYEDDKNPCFVENSKGEAVDRVCTMNRKENQNFKDIIANRWNVSCFCKEPGFQWRSEFGMCIDINECVTGQHNCDKDSDDCLNLPGTFECVCKWNYWYDESLKKCVKHNLFKESALDISEHYYTFLDYVKSILKYLGITN